MTNKKNRKLPVVSLGAEHLVMGNLMRRNILTYKAPPYNEGYDLICMHPDPRKKRRILRIQVKSRYQSDSDGAFPLKGKSIDAFDYLIIVFLNIGYFYRKMDVKEGIRDAEIYTLPNSLVRKNHHTFKSGWERVHASNINIERYKNDKGIEIIANKLGIEYPKR